MKLRLWLVLLLAGASAAALAACDHNSTSPDGAVKGDQGQQREAGLDGPPTDVGPDSTVDAPKDVVVKPDSGDDLVENPGDTTVDTQPPPDSDITAPAVKSTNPTSNQTSVALNTTVSAVFTEPIAPATVTASSFLLATGPVAIPGAVTASGDTATFTPARALCPLRQYDATLKQTITDLASNPLSADYNWSFTAADGAWSGLKTATADANTVRSAMAENGDAFVMWIDGSPAHVYAARFDGGTGSWGAAKQLDASTTNLQSGDIAADASGNAVAVWRESAQSDVLGARYDATSGAWSTPVALDSATGAASEPSVAMSPTGTAMVVFEQQLTSTTSAMYYNAHDGSSWGGQQAIPDPGTRPYIYVRAASDGLGNYFASWTDRLGTTYALRASRYDGTSKTWSSNSTQLASGIGSYNHDLVAGPTAAFAVWSAYSSPNYQVAAARYAGSAWGAAATLSGSVTSYADRPSIATDLAGNALAVWQQSSIYVNTYSATNSSWGSAPSALASAGSQPTVVMDAAGNGLALWGEDSGTSGQRLRAARYLASSGAFGTPAWVLPARTGFLWEPMSVATNACGQAVAIVQYSNEGPYDPPDYLVFR